MLEQSLLLALFVVRVVVHGPVGSEAQDVGARDLVRRDVVEVRHLGGEPGSGGIEGRFKIELLLSDALEAGREGAAEGPRCVEDLERAACAMRGGRDDLVGSEEALRR